MPATKPPRPARLTPLERPAQVVPPSAPGSVRMHADGFVRGGIRTFVIAEHRRQGWKPAPRVDLPTAEW